MLDLYRFQLEEISAAALKSGEDEWLMEERVKLSHSEKMMDSVSGAYDLVFGEKGLGAVSTAVSRLEDVVQYDEKELKPILEQLQSAYYQLEDVAFQLRNYRDDIEFNPERLDEVEERLDLISSLRRKYGESVDEILAYYNNILQETSALENKDERLEELKTRRDELLAALIATAEELSEARQMCAADLVEAKWKRS